MSVCQTCICVYGCDWYSRVVVHSIVFFQAEDGIRDLVRSRGLGDVYKRQLDGRYVVERLLGRGGMGEVYAARRRSLDDLVAILSLIHI